MTERATASRFVARALTALAAALALAAVGAAAAQDMAGTYVAEVEQGTLTVELRHTADGFEGTLQGPGIHFQLQGWVEDGVGYGVASSSDGQLGFEAMVEGDLLGLWFYEVVDGRVLPETEIEIVLQRVGGVAGATPPAQGVQGGKQVPGRQGAVPPAAGVPGGAAGAPAPQQGSPVIAQGAYASLTQDDALAFIEALEFVLSEIGYAYSFTEADVSQALQALAGSFPQLGQNDQVVLSQARSIWERVRANWPAASQADKEEFALGVLVLAFGEQTVAQWAGGRGGGGGGGGGGQCTTFEECTSQFVDQDTWNDTFNAQGCWAAAGCEGYDTSTGTFDYGSYGDY